MDTQRVLQQGVNAVPSLPPGLGAGVLSAPAPSSKDDVVADLKRRLDEEQMRSLQLQCVLDAKDRELTLVRQHISSGESESEALLQALQHENEALRRQLADAKVALQAAKDVQAQLPPPSPQDRAVPNLSNGREHAEVSRASSTPAAQPTASGSKWPGQQGAAQQSAPAASSSVQDEVLALNVSGVEMQALRSTLTLVPSSHLSAMFRRHSTLAPPWDGQRRHFLPFRADVFAVVLDALQAQQVLGIKPCTCNWGEVISKDDTMYFQQLLQFFDLHRTFYREHTLNSSRSNMGVPTLHPSPRLQGGGGSSSNVAGAAVKGHRNSQGSVGPTACGHGERVSPSPSTSALPLMVPDAVAAALRPRANADSGNESNAPTALDATQLALAGLRVPNMYELMAKKAAAGDP